MGAAWLLSQLPGNAILWRWGAGLMIFLGVFVLGYFKGNAHGTTKLAEYILSQNAASIKMVAKQEKIAEKANAVVGKSVKIVRVKGATIIKEVPVYVTQKADSNCDVPIGFVRLHTAALENTTAGNPSESDGTPSGYAISQVLETDAKAFAVLNECKVKLEGIKQFYNDLRQLRE